MTLVTLGGGPAHARGDERWIEWAQKWIAADEDMARHGDAAERLQAAMVRRDAAQRVLSRILPSTGELIQTLHSVQRRRFALVAVVVHGSASDRVFESVLEPWSDADDATRRYRVVALRNMTARQFEAFGGRVQDLLRAEPSQRVRLEGLTLVKRLSPSSERDMLAWYFELEDPILTRWAFAIAATEGDDTVVSVMKKLNERTKIGAVRLLCTHVTPTLVRSEELCESRHGAGPDQ